MLSTHFSHEEFACHCGCGFAEVDPRLIDALELLRARIQRPIRVNSGCRCPTRNSRVGGAITSRHLLGQAADIYAPGLTARQLYAHAVQVPAFADGGIGVMDEEEVLHVDVRDGPARWCYHNGSVVPWFEV